MKEERKDKGWGRGEEREKEEMFDIVCHFPLQSQISAILLLHFHGKQKQMRIMFAYKILLILVIHK